MDAMSTLSKTSDLLLKLQQDYSPVGFVAGKNFYWSPADQTIYYRLQSVNKKSGKWALLHEVAHSILGHKTYSSDVELLGFEVDAWHLAKNLANKYGLEISDEHIDECLNTYRDWLYSRSACPRCFLSGVQTQTKTYMCLNCQNRWQVSSSRFCRPYRMVARSNSKESEQNKKSLFL